ncbi:beta-phosphoglucomutase [Lacticaseibacillus sp. GG6-2]
MLKGLIFDLDGVIADTARFHLQAWNQLAQRLDIVLPPEANDALRGRSRMDSLNLILGYGDKVDAYSDYEKAAFAQSKNDLYLQLIQTLTPADILPGIAQLLQDAKALGLHVSIASASKNAPTILKHLQLDSAFDAIVDPAKLHRGKPDPEIFILAQQALNLQADEVISFEDASAGVQAIKAANQFAVGIGDAQVLKLADYIVASTADLQLSKIVAAFKEVSA